MSEKTYEKRTIWCTNKRGQKIYGVATVPKKEGRFPLVIFSHGYGYNGTMIEEKRLASAGIAVYAFDFCGGSPQSKSDGSPLDMSVMTEAEDLEAVLDRMVKQPFVDKERIYLSGHSQGGLVCIVVGVRRQDMIRGLILFCPAILIVDYEKIYHGGHIMPETVHMYGMTVSRRYADDTRDYDVYGDMERFKKPVLYFQGDRDEFGLLAYAGEAKKHFPDVTMYILKDTGHMLNHGHEDFIFEKMMDFINKTGS